MALGFGGLGAAMFAGMREFERAEDRETAQKDREAAKKEREEDRAYQRQQREYQAGQQKRTLDEQARDDQFREGLAGVRTADQISEAAAGTINGQAAPVLRDDEGNLMPGAVETKPAQTVSRLRNKDDIMAEYAEIARKAGKTDQALKFDEQAATESMKRGKALFAQWSASTPDTGNLEDAIKQATQIYNGDRLPGQVQGYKMNPDGSATVDIKNTATGQAVPVTFKNVAELKQGLEGYYSPETLDAYRKSLREAAIKAKEKAAEPYTLKPGEERRVGDKVVGRNDTGFVLGPNGEPIPLKGGSAGSKSTGKAPKTPVEDAMDILKDSMGGKGDGSPEGAARYTRAQSYLDGIYTTNPNISPRTAAAIAADASADPTKITMQLDNRTGQISKVYANPDFEGGRQFNLGPNSGSLAEMEKTVGKSGMQQAVAGMVSQLVEVVPAEQQPAFRTQLLQAATDPKVREQAIAAARTNGQDVQAMIRQLDLIKAYAAPAAVPGRTNKTDVGGLRMPQTDPNSPAGRAQARQAQLRADVQAAEARRAEEQQRLSAQFRADARKLSPTELEIKYDALRGSLPREDQIELRRLASQAYRSGQ